METFLTGAGGEHQDTVRGLVTIEGGGGGAHEGAHVGDVLGIEHGHTVTGQAGAGIDAPGVARRGHRQGRERNTVQNVEGVVGVLDGLRATHDDLGLAAGAGGRLVDLDARDLAREGIDHVGFARDEDLLVQFLDIVGHGLLGALDAEGGDDDALEDVLVLLEGDVDRTLSVDGDHRIGHANIGDPHRRSVVGDLHGVIAVEIRDGADGRLAFNEHAGTDQGLAVGVGDPAGNGTALLLGSIRLPGKQDVGAVDGVLQSRLGGELVKRGTQRGVLDMDRYPLVHVDTLVCGKQIAGLRFDAFYHVVKTGILHIERHPHALGVQGQDRCKERHCQAELPNDRFTHTLSI